MEGMTANPTWKAVRGAQHLVDLLDHVANFQIVAVTHQDLHKEQEKKKHG